MCLALAVAAPCVKQGLEEEGHPPCMAAALPLHASRPPSSLRLLQALPQPEALLVPLVPTLAARMGHLPVQETSEEVKLQLQGLLGSLASRAGQHMGPVAHDVARMICRALEDPFHEIKKAST